MPINPFTAYRLAAQAEAAIAELNSVRNFARDMNGSNARLHNEIIEARAQRNAATVALATAQERLATTTAALAAANAKLARMTGNLKRGSVKPTPA